MKTDDLPPWDEATEVRTFSPEDEAWARALCIAGGRKPDKLVGNPPAPNWQSWVSYGRLSRRAAEIVNQRNTRGE